MYKVNIGIYTTLTPQIKGKYRAIFFIFPCGQGYIKYIPVVRDISLTTGIYLDISLTTRLIALMQADSLLNSHPQPTITERFTVYTVPFVTFNCGFNTLIPKSSKSVFH